MFEEGNRSYYTHDDSDGLSNSDEDDQEIRLLMAYENNDVEKEEVTKLKVQLEIVTRVREQLQDVVKDQSITIQRLESKTFSVKEDLKESKKQNKEALEEQVHEVLELRQQVEEGRKAEENIRKQYLEKEK